MNTRSARKRPARKHRYTVTHFFEDVNHYHPTQFFVAGHLGAMEISREMLDQIVLDGLGPASLSNPHATSPWLLIIPRSGMGILRAKWASTTRRHAG